MKFQDSALAHALLDDLTGIEIGGAAHNPFNLPNCKNVDYTDSQDTCFKKGEMKLCGEAMPVDYVAPGDALPFPDATWDYVISSHVIEHFFDPIAAVEEWLRVIRPGGYVFIIGPKQDALPGEDRPCTTVAELLDRHEGRMRPEEVNMGGYQTSSVTGLPLNEHGHWSVWNLPDFLALCRARDWNVIAERATDDKVGNGWCVVLRKVRSSNTLREMGVNLDQSSKERGYSRASAEPSNQ
jgi:SAM-dependent methyltransferase